MVAWRPKWIVRKDRSTCYCALETCVEAKSTSATHSCHIRTRSTCYNERILGLEFEYKYDGLVGDWQSLSLWFLCFIIGRWTNLFKYFVRRHWLKSQWAVAWCNCISPIDTYFYFLAVYVPRCLPCFEHQCGEWTNRARGESLDHFYRMTMISIYGCKDKWGIWPSRSLFACCTDFRSMVNRESQTQLDTRNMHR